MAADNPYDPPRVQAHRESHPWSFSWWTHLLTHEETVWGEQDACHQQLLQHYRRLGAAILDSQPPDSLTYARGTWLASCLSLGSETACRHVVTVRLREDNEGVHIIWSIDLKLCGLSVGKNAIIEEMKELAANW